MDIQQWTNAFMKTVIGIRSEHTPFPHDEDDEISCTIWYDLEDNIHKEGAPAIIADDGGEQWYRHGKLHRDDGPAIIIPFNHNGIRYYEFSYYKEDEAHREPSDGPAIIDTRGNDIRFFYNGVLHNPFGPAVDMTFIDDNGEEKRVVNYYLGGVRCSKFMWKRLRKCKEMKAPNSFVADPIRQIYNKAINIWSLITR